MNSTLTNKDQIYQVVDSNTYQILHSTDHFDQAVTYAHTVSQVVHINIIDKDDCTWEFKM